MAEALALAGAIIAIVQIAGAATKLSQSLYRTSRRAGSARGDIQAFAMDIGAFASVIRVAHDAILAHCDKESDSAVLRYVRDHNILGQLIQQSVRIKKHIETVRPRIQDLRGRFSVINHVKWVWKRDEVKALHPEMECVKTNLLVMMHVVALEIAQQGEQSDATRREIKSLKRQIEVHIQTISILQELQERASLKGSNENHESAYIFGPRRQSSLIQLAQSMVETGRVPELDDTHSDPRGSASSSFWEPEIEHDPVLVLNDDQSFYLHNPPDITLTTESFVSRDSALVHTGEIVRRQASTVESGDQVPAADASNSNTHSVERDYSAVHSADNVLYLNTDHPVQGESGCVTTHRPEGKVTVTAVLDRELQGNVVSQDFAIQNELEIQEPEEEDGVLVEFVPGVRMRSSGQVVLEWSKEFSHRKPFRVRCWVVAYSGRPLYFGKPFVEKRDHYWGRSIGQPL